MLLSQTGNPRIARVLFVCLGNACRSQMAEAFTNAYGGDILQAASAGVLPANRISRTMQKVMKEKNVEIRSKRPQQVQELNLSSFDLIVNLSEYALPSTSTEIMRAFVPDPTGKGDRFQRKIRDEIADIVQSLINWFRERAQPTHC